MVTRKPVPQSSPIVIPPYPVTPDEEIPTRREHYFQSPHLPTEFGPSRGATPGRNRASFPSKNLSYSDLPPPLRVGIDGIHSDNNNLQKRYSDVLSSSAPYSGKNHVSGYIEEIHLESWDTSDLENSINSYFDSTTKLSSIADIGPSFGQVSNPLNAPRHNITGQTSDDKFLVTSDDIPLNLNANDERHIKLPANITPLRYEIPQPQPKHKNEKKLEPSEIHELSADSATESISTQTQNISHRIHDLTASPSTRHEGPGNAIPNDQTSTITNSRNNLILSQNGASAESIPNENTPSLPPRSQEMINSDSSISSTPNSRKQKEKMYDIRKINLINDNASNSFIVTPILIQNANGPCPLLALVNSLTLSTPSNLNTPLINTLRSREQISLGLLLDAVFDELMSGRRSNPSNELPDVTDLYSFLLSLHTGMNVNPCFVKASSRKSTIKTQNSTPQDHVTECEVSSMSTFEETREVLLYSAFKIPLVHGWLPQPESPEYFALSRSAKTYEEAQNMIINEEALECKFSREGLNSEEQSVLQDISIVKGFLSFNATQLTQYGLDTITTSISPGSVAILFRNNHFSTLYRHPKTLKLLQLVTDMGYAKHEEIVWESLVNVTGELSEFFTGDFRLVSDVRAGSSTSPTNIKNLPDQTSSSNRTNLQNSSPRSLKLVQEDHDLALALQIQEEEEQSARVKSRRRSHVDGRDQLSPQNSLGARPAIPPRRSNLNLLSQNVLQSEIPVSPPPPSYEVAATQQAYIPADNPPPSHTDSNPSPNTASHSRVGSNRSHRWSKRTDTGVTTGSEKREKECTIM